MKTYEEISSEARLLARSAERVVAEAPGERHRLTIVSMPAEGRPNLRWIDAARAADAIEYRLVEIDPRLPATERPIAVVVSDDVFDVLVDGYQLAEAERLAYELNPFAEANDDGVEDDAKAIAEIEEIVRADTLSPAARLRLRAGIVSFLEGRIEPSEFINAVVERQYYRESVRELVAERALERLTVGSP